MESRVKGENRALLKVTAAFGPGYRLATGVHSGCFHRMAPDGDRGRGFQALQKCSGLINQLPADAFGKIRMERCHNPVGDKSVLLICSE